MILKSDCGEKRIKKCKLEGIKEGIKTGEENKAISMAIAMKKDGADINLISKYTGLSVDEVRKLPITEKNFNI